MKARFLVRLLNWLRLGGGVAALARCRSAPAHACARASLVCLLACACASVRSFVCLPAPTRACARAGAGKLAWGAFGTDACPAGSSVITDYAQCKAAAATAEKTFMPNNVSADGAPRGCYCYLATATICNVVLNTHPTGGTNDGAAPLCAFPATGGWVRARGGGIFIAHGRARIPTRAQDTRAPSNQRWRARSLTRARTETRAYGRARPHARA